MREKTEVQAWIENWLHRVKNESRYLQGKIDESSLKDFTKEELVYLIFSLTEQVMRDTRQDEDIYDTYALTDYAMVAAVLAKLDLAEIRKCYSRRAIFKLKDIYGNCLQNK